MLYVVSLQLPALTVQETSRFGDVWTTEVSGVQSVRAGLYWSLRFAFGPGLRVHAIGFWLGALNLIPLVALGLWRLRVRRAALVLPVVVAIGGFVVWALLPSSPEAVRQAREVWVIHSGYHVWLGSLAGMCVALGLRWRSRSALDAIWSQRPTARTSGELLDPQALLRVPLAVRVLCERAHRLRQTLERDPLGDDATREAWEWHQAAGELSEVDRGAAEDLGVPLRGAEHAIGRFWDAEADESLGALADMDAALHQVVATATAPAVSRAFR